MFMSAISPTRSPTQQVLPDPAAPAQPTPLWGEWVASSILESFNQMGSLRETVDALFLYTTQQTETINAQAAVVDSQAETINWQNGEISALRGDVVDLRAHVRDLEERLKKTEEWIAAIKERTKSL